MSLLFRSVPIGRFRRLAAAPSHAFSPGHRAPPRHTAAASAHATPPTATPIGARAAGTLLGAVTLAALALPMPAAAQPAAAQTVVVTASRLPQPLATVLADVSVLDRAAIERHGAVGVADVLAGLPGVEFARNGGAGTVTTVLLRGAEARHTAVYIDGVRVDSQATGGALWEQIPLEAIERIEVLRGPAAAVYGSDAVGGVVQLFTRRGRGAAQPSAAVTVGGHGTRVVQAAISGSTGADGAVDYTLSASAGDSDGFDARTDAAIGHNPDADGWRRRSLQGRLGVQVDEVHRVDASLLTSRLRSDFDGFAPGVDDENRHALRTGSLAWQARWSETATTRLVRGRTDSTLETQPSFYRTETTLDDTTLLHEQRVGAHVLSAIAERREDALVNPATAFAGDLRGTRRQDALGLGWRFDDGPRALQAQARRDDDSEFGGRSTGSLALGWRFADGWRATAAAATAFRAPTLFQRFSEFGNPTLVPETGRNVELGLAWQAGASELSLVAWRNRLSNLIDFGPPGPCANGFGCYVNVGRATLEGATLAGRTRLHGVTLSGSLGWHDPRNDGSGRVLPRRARQLAALQAETRVAGVTLGAALRAAGHRFENAANTQRLAGYGVVDLFASLSPVPGLALELRLDNAGDKAYELARAYATGGRQGQLTLRWAMR